MIKLTFDRVILSFAGIPYTDFKDRLRKTKEEEKRGNTVTFDEGLIYSNSRRMK